MTPMSRPGVDPHLDPTARLDSRVFPPHPIRSVAPTLAGSSSPRVPPVIASSSAGQLGDATDPFTPAVPSLTHHAPMTDHDERRLDGHNGVARQLSSPPRKYRTILPSSVLAPPPVNPPEELHDLPDSPTRGTFELRSHSPDMTAHEQRPRKKRNMYTPQQRDMLVHYFETVTDHPTKDQRKLLIKLVGTDDQTVRVWFQNYRAKVQRDVKQVGGPSAEVTGDAYWAAPVVAGYAPVLVSAGAAAAVRPNMVGFVVPPGYAGPVPAPVPGYAWVAAPLAGEYPLVHTMGPPSPVHHVASRAGAPSPPPFAAIPTTTDSAQCMIQIVNRPLSSADGSFPASPVSRHGRAKRVPPVSQPSSASAHASLAAAGPTPPPLPGPLPSDGDVMHSGGAAVALSKSLGWSRGSPSKRRGGGDAPSSPTKRAKHKDTGSPAHALAAQLSSLGLAASRADSVPAVALPPAFVLPDATVATALLDDEAIAVILPALPATGAVGGAPALSDLVNAAMAMDLDLVPNDTVPLPFPTDTEPLPFPTDAVPLPTDAAPLPFHADTAPHVPSPPPFQRPADRTRWIKADADSMLDVTAETPFRDAAASPSVLFGSAGTVGEDSPDVLIGARLGAVPADAGRDAWVDVGVPEPLDVDVALQRWAETEPDPVVASKVGDVSTRGPVWMAGGTLGFALGTACGANDRVDSGARLAM
ncbi:hypothetical protein AMAG_11503 [Allomyces macrogynus ATCC 38327]|uniref:Homeobox domain-containing protein n=1 Tax=Allomyces macrogynus (strain ATCC 38327) TaxID=578462 RepID=A0A0L0SVD9_ALLM3|nr:hypothetical protein AMAG_11503 [Allomyces macrogynus ATCC 38327]|eukprot:KNE66360.1 hypothetical protein AMAG_11503 [Allomyces macrogynus ATCC 38327]